MGSFLWTNRLRLPKRGHLPVTSPVDVIDGYYHRVFGWIMRSRLVWVLGELPAGHIHRALEIGYGSGILQYQLAPHAELSVAIDVHEYGALVRQRLADDGIRAEIVSGDGAVLPFASASFDAVVIVSTLEFIPDPASCLREIRRALRPGGRLVFVTPRVLRWSDIVFSWLGGLDPERHFRGGRERVQRALSSELPNARRHRRPAWLPRSLAPYEVVVFEQPVEPLRNTGVGCRVSGAANSVDHAWGGERKGGGDITRPLRP